ncbi:MAG: peptidoglycan DD-metalloendopeptidase family protein [bacterium]|nr:peptidoglycan DD-metalloendopeptidase family protein [bacterium]
MQTLPQTHNRILGQVHALRQRVWQFRMRVPARFAIYGVLLIIAGAVAFQNVRATTLETAYKGHDRLARYFEIGSNGGLITEGLETLQRGKGGENYLSAGISLPSLALASSGSDTLGLLNRDQNLAITNGTALADQSISLTTIADRPREGVLSYTVQSGDTLSTIAEDFGISLRTLLWANGLTDTSTITGGDALKILPVSGVTHKVADGDTLSEIAKKYQASVDKILSFNNLTSETAIKIDQELIVPGGIKPAPPKPAPAVGVSLASNSGNSGFGSISQSSGDTSATGSFAWPSACSYISQYYGWHTGIDIACPYGSALSAADGGTVIEAGWAGGYGYNIVISHGNGFTTRYAHIKEGGIHVNVGQQVSRGQYIADEGSTGFSTGPHLHFEIMINGSFVNPLNYL